LHLSAGFYEGFLGIVSFVGEVEWGEQVRGPRSVGEMVGG
jgi:hypothetical protein